MDTLTALVLTNAIYFKGTWMRTFRKEDTSPGDFVRGGPGTIGNVPLMSREGAFPYLDRGTFQALELPYDGDDASMIVFLPRAVDGLAEFEKSLTAARLADWVTTMALREVAVVLPRFTVTVPLDAESPTFETVTV